MGATNLLRSKRSLNRIEFIIIIAFVNYLNLYCVHIAEHTYNKDIATTNCNNLYPHHTTNSD